MATRIPDGLFVDGTLTLGNVTVQPGWSRTALVQEAAVAYPIPWEAWRVHDAYQTTLPGTAAADDLGLLGGTYGTDVPSLQTSDAKATTVTQYARCLMPLPVEYVDASAVSLMFHAGMRTTISDGTATLDAQLFLSGKEGLVSGSDLVTTAATTINSLVMSDISFSVTSGGLVSADVLDIRITMAITDAATPTSVLGWIGAAYLKCGIKG